MTTQESSAPVHTHADALTVTETALLLRVHPRTVWRYLADGKLTPLRHPLNRRVYVCEQEVRGASARREEKAWNSRYRERPEVN